MTHFDRLVYINRHRFDKGLSQKFLLYQKESQQNKTDIIDDAVRLLLGSSPIINRFLLKLIQGGKVVFDNEKDINKVLA